MPSAVRKKAKTITIRVKLVITSTREGASTSRVMIRTILSVVTSSVGSCGAVIDKSTEGSTGLLGSDGTEGILEGDGSTGVILELGSADKKHTQMQYIHKSFFKITPKSKE